MHEDIEISGVNIITNGSMKKLRLWTLSANRCTGASRVCASSTNRKISPIAVSPPGLRTSMVIFPFRFMLPAATSAYNRKMTLFDKTETGSPSLSTFTFPLLWDPGNKWCIKGKGHKRTSSLIQKSVGVSLFGERFLRSTKLCDLWIKITNLTRRKIRNETRNNLFIWRKWTPQLFYHCQICWQERTSYILENFISLTRCPFMPTVEMGNSPP